MRQTRQYWLRLEEKLGPHLEPVDRHTHEETMPLGHADVEALVAMGPSAWHTDLDLGRPIEVMTDMANSRKAGFTAYQSTLDSFTDLLDKLRQEKIIP